MEGDFAPTEPSISEKIKAWKLWQPLKIMRRSFHHLLIDHVLTKYWYWRLRHEPFFPNREKIRAEITAFSICPIYTLITVVKKETALDHFSGTVRSVQVQHYPHWNWVILCDPRQRETIRDRIPAGMRGRVSLRDSSDLTNPLSDLASKAGDFIAFLEANDELSPFALLEVTRKINREPTLDLIFSDEDHLNQRNRRYDPWFKSEYNPYNLRSCNYLIHFLVLRASLALQINRVQRPDLETDINFYDLVLHASEQANNITHIPAVLYHSRHLRWQSLQTLQVNRADLQSLRMHLERTGIRGTVESNDYPDSFQICYAVQGQPLVSIIIPNKDQRPVLKRCIDSIREKTTWPNYEILIAENNSSDPGTFAYYDTLTTDSGFRGQVLVWDQPFNYAAINNWAARQAAGAYLLFLNNDTEIITPNWIEALLGIAQQPNVGAVGAKLYFPDGKIQHAGCGYGQFRQTFFFHLAEGMDGAAPGYYGFAEKIGSFMMVTGACLLVNREKFDNVKGFDETYPLSFNDADFCLKLMDRGLYNIYTPYCCLIHYESLTRGYNDTKMKQSAATQKFEILRRKWQRILARGDPFISSNLRYEHYFEDQIR